MQSGSSTVTRFAPSPTGRLHLGHAVSALAAHDRARIDRGAFHLRIEDIDTTRCRADYAEAIRDDLRWLGIGCDGPVVVQSERLPLYQDALDRLIADGLAYPCFCSRADIVREVAASLAAPHGADGPLYPGTCRGLPFDPARIAAEPHNCRLDSAAAIARTGPLHWRDERAGTVAVDPAALGDVILKGRDRPASYHLAAVIDDAAAGVTLVVRGRDLFASTHVQVMLQAVLGWRRRSITTTGSSPGRTAGAWPSAMRPPGSTACARPRSMARRSPKTCAPGACPLVLAGWRTR